MQQQNNNNNARSLNVRLQNCTNEIAAIDEQAKALRKRRKALVEERHLLEEQLKSRDQLQDETDFAGNAFPWSAEAQQLLEQVFKLSSFRSHQLKCINATLSGHDVLLIMPTGGGKSLCFQLTALISKGLTLVVSPLISLMEDQLNALRELGIPAAILSSDSSREQLERVIKELGAPAGPSYRMLYVTPERLAKSKRIMTLLEKCYANRLLKRLVIDEVHCCSQWGHDFRTDYQFLGIMRNQFPDTPILGLTATATPMVIEDVKNILNIKGCYVLKDSFFRDNLRYAVERVDELKKEELAERMVGTIRRRFPGQSGLVYCLSIKEVEEVTEKLNAGGVKAMPYHAQLSSEARKRAYLRWFTDQVQVIVATVAFGMGINKNSVRFVLHYTLSKSFENYYQETGRAGRDGRPAHCILYLKFADVFRVSSLTFTERHGLQNIYAMMAYCFNRRTCRKRQIADYFGDSWAHQCGDRCDNCATGGDGDGQLVEVDVTEDVADLMNLLAFVATRQDRKLTFPKLMDLWFGKGEKRLRPESLVICRHSREAAQTIVACLLVDGYLKEEFHFTPYSTISYVTAGPSSWLMKGGGGPQQPIRYWLPPSSSSTTKKSGGKQSAKRASTTEGDDSPEQMEAVASKRKRTLKSDDQGKSKVTTNGENTQKSTVDYELITLE